MNEEEDRQLAMLCAAAMHNDGSASMLYLKLRMDDLIDDATHGRNNEPYFRVFGIIGDKRTSSYIGTATTQKSAARTFAKWKIGTNPIWYWMWLAKNGEPESKVATEEPEKDWYASDDLLCCGETSPEKDHDCTRRKGHVSPHRAVDPVFGNVMDSWSILNR